MASGIIMKTRPVPKPPFPPPASFGINRVPEPKPLDLEKLLGLGTDLVARAWDEVQKACGLFRHLDELARVNRSNLGNKDVVTVLTDLRRDAEVSLERGFYAFDVAMEVLWRLKGHYPPALGEPVDKEFRMRQKSYYHALGGVAGRAYLKMYELVDVTPTTGDLSAIPPGLHFDDAATVAWRRYGSRYHVAMWNYNVDATSHWRRRLVRGIQSGILPGRILPGSGPPAGAGKDLSMKDVGGEEDPYRAWVRSELDSLVASDWSSPRPLQDSSSFGKGFRGRRHFLSTIHEEDEPEENETAGLATASHLNQTRYPPPQKSPEGGRRASTRIRNKEAAAKAAADAPKTPAPGAPLLPTNRRKRAWESLGGDGDSQVPGGKRARWEQRLRFRAEEGQDMSPLTPAELARLPWNEGLLNRSEDDEFKSPEPLPRSELAEATEIVPPLRAWWRSESPNVDFGFERDAGEDDTTSAEDVSQQQPSTGSNRGSTGVSSNRNPSTPARPSNRDSSTPAHPPSGGFTSSPPEPTLPEIHAQSDTDMGQELGPETSQVPRPDWMHSSTEPSTGASQTPAPSSSHESSLEAMATQVISTSPLQPQEHPNIPPFPETPSLNPPGTNFGQQTQPSGAGHLPAHSPLVPGNRVQTPPGGTPDMSFGSIFTDSDFVPEVATPGGVVSDAPSGSGNPGRISPHTIGGKAKGASIFPQRTPKHNRPGSIFTHPRVEELGGKVATPASAVSDASSGFGGPTTRRPTGKTALPAGHDLDEGSDEGSVEDLDEVKDRVDEDMGEDVGEKEHERVQMELRQREEKEEGRRRGGRRRETREEEKKRRQEERDEAFARRLQNKEYGGDSADSADSADDDKWKTRSNNTPTKRRNKYRNQDEWVI
ncbi:uncharacterized protein DNG_02942 [Cephalotrichum gorgonifer]|uniref:Uncharacterized protein n=1 Tax=Cephalotrichum gorgonifer TaxID=2041049 RepID=A0AAE8STR5_9PEZI|nr:uncharacterized protein DNG_02942 [Cephalotrichum gorgonifer]